uniref:Cyclin-J-like protein n=1 Tax=Paramormyrops kingsleyae TaxID=1676925 RepID=A0A3B3TFU9_9TELE
MRCIHVLLFLGSPRLPPCPAVFQELKLPLYRAQSPQIGLRRYFADLLAILSNRYQLCPTARHLAVYLLDLFMDHYEVAIKQLYVIALSCLLLASKSSSGDIPGSAESFSKFEEKEDRVPKLEHLNALGFMCSLNLVLGKRDLIRMELLLLETFGWNLCLPTPAHFIDYYLRASVQESDLHNGWPLSSHSKTLAFMDKYAHYFLEVSLQDHAFLSFRPSQVAASCIAASRVCLQILPSWTSALHLLTGYTWEHLTPCVELMLLDVKEANKSKSAPSPAVLQPRGQPAPPSPASLDRQASASSQHLIFHPGGYAHLSQHSAPVSQLHVIPDTQALGPVLSQDYLQSHRTDLFSGTSAGGAVHPYPNLASGLRAVPLQGPLSMQVAVAAEARHCLGVAYSAGYLGSRHTFAAGCFDR